MSPSLLDVLPNTAGEIVDAALLLLLDQGSRSGTSSGI